MNEDKKNVLSLSLLSTADAFKAIHQEWNELLATSKANTIFLTWEWTHTWWEVYGHAHQLLLLKIQDEKGTCVGLAPFKIARRHILGIPYRQVEFMGSCEKTHPDYLDLIVAPGYHSAVTDAVWNYLIAHKNLWDTIYCSDIPSTSETHPRLNHLAQQAGFVTHLKQPTLCPYLPITTSWEEYLKSLSSNQRYNTQRKEKRITKLYPMNLEEVYAGTDITVALEELFDLHKTIWNTKGEEGAFHTHPLNKTFHCKIAETFSALGWIVIYSLKIDGKTAAILYAYRYNHKIFYYQMGRSPAWAEYGVGQVMIKLILQSLFKNGESTAFYFLQGTESYKYHWTKAEHVNLHLCLWNQTVRGKIVCFVAGIERWGRNMLRPIRRRIEKILSK